MTTTARLLARSLVRSLAHSLERWARASEQMLVVMSQIEGPRGYTHW